MGVVKSFRQEIGEERRFRVEQRLKSFDKTRLLARLGRYRVDSVQRVTSADRSPRGGSKT